MTEPDPKTLKVSLDWMMVDVHRWREAAEGVGEAREVAIGLDLNSYDFSHPAHLVGATRTYGELQDKLIRLLTEAHDAFEKMADTLQSVVANYEKTEEENRDRMNRVNRMLEEIE